MNGTNINRTLTMEKLNRNPSSRSNPKQSFLSIKGKRQASRCPIGSRIIIIIITRTIFIVLSS